MATYSSTADIWLGVSAAPRAFSAVINLSGSDVDVPTVLSYQGTPCYCTQIKTGTGGLLKVVTADALKANPSSPVVSSILTYDGEVVYGQFAIVKSTANGTTAGSITVGA